MFYNIFAVLQVLATIPFSSLSCDCERSMSTLRNLKNYLRDTMSHDRLIGLALMDTHAEIELDLINLIDLFQPTPQKNEDGKYLGRLDTLLFLISLAVSRVLVSYELYGFFNP